MDPDQPSSDDAEPAATSDDQVISSSPITTTTAARSYECTFCKRGFSNAQALGGHMNIHRKDRAKLNKMLQPGPNHPHFLFDIAQPAPSSYMPELAPNIVAPNQSWASSSPKQLPLFVETPSRISSRTLEEIKVLEDGQVGAVELDLELRLGPEQPDASASVSAMGFKEFV